MNRATKYGLVSDRISNQNALCTSNLAKQEIPSHPGACDFFKGLITLFCISHDMQLYVLKEK